MAKLNCLHEQYSNSYWFTQYYKLTINDRAIFFAGCDLKLEMEKLKQGIYEKFVFGNQPPMYEPSEFIECCQQAGAPNISEHILQAVSDDRHSQRRRDLIRV